MSKKSSGREKPIEEKSTIKGGKRSAVEAKESMAVETEPEQVATLEQGTVAGQEAVAEQEAIAGQEATAKPEAVIEQEATAEQEAVAEQEATAGQEAVAEQEATAEQEAVAEQEATAGQETTAKPEAALESEVYPETADLNAEKASATDDFYSIGSGSEAINAAQMRLASLEAKLAEADEEVLRIKAEAQNNVMRAEKQAQRSRKFALQDIAADLLPVVDNLERALASFGDIDKSAINPAIKEGVELTLKSFLDILAKYQIMPIDPFSEPFDPEQHQAVSTVTNKDVEPNTVLEVLQKGYTLNERLIRPAMVVVSKS